MKQGGTLQGIAAELQRQADTKRDFIAPEGKLSIASNGSSTLTVGDEGEYHVTDHCHR